MEPSPESQEQKPGNQKPSPGTGEPSAEIQKMNWGNQEPRFNHGTKSRETGTLTRQPWNQVEGMKFIQVTINLHQATMETGIEPRQPKTFKGKQGTKKQPQATNDFHCATMEPNTGNQEVNPGNQ